MPSCPRRTVVAKGEVGVYHCWNRCVQRAWLCGQDPVTGMDYEYRRQVIEEVEQQLARLFAIDIGFHAELINHLHLILRTRPDLAAEYSDDELLRRWWIAARWKRNGTDTIPEPSAEQLAQERAALARSGQVAAAVVRCFLVHGHTLRTPGAEVQSRIGHEWHVLGASLRLPQPGRRGRDPAVRDLRRPEPDPRRRSHRAGSGPLYVRLSPHPGATAAAGPVRLHTGSRRLAVPLDDPRSGSEPTGRRAPRRPWRASDKGLLAITLDQYLELLDWTGRQLPASGKCAIPASLEPILVRLGLRPEHWLASVLEFDRRFGFVVGALQRLREAACRAGRRWFRGAAACAAAFA